MNPKFANGWYDTPPVYQLRQEFQHLYALLSGGDIVNILVRDHEVNPEADWGMHFIAEVPLTVTLPSAPNGVKIALANHSGGTVKYEAMPGVRLASAGNLTGVSDGGVVGALSGGNDTWYLYGALT